MNNLLEYNGKTYYIDLDKLMEWVSETPVKQKNIQTTITQIYPMEFDEKEEDTAQKEITEVKNSLNETMNSFRYDLIRSLINVVITPIMSADESQALPFDEDNILLGQALAFNTLLQAGIIIET